MNRKINVFFIIILFLSMVYLLRSLLSTALALTVTVLYTISIGIVILLIFFENRNPARTLTWVIVLVALPGIGFIVYLLFGQTYRRQRSYYQKADEDERIFESVQRHNQKLETHENRFSTVRDNFYRLALRLGSPISFHTYSKVLTDGKETFMHIKYALNRAEHHIHMEYYTLRHDVLGKEIQKILIEKAEAGVEVRVLYDAVGSWQLSKLYRDELTAAGVQIVAFAPVKIPLLNHRINYRNHRKIIVIDGTVGFAGGLNIGDEYIGNGKQFKHWRDTHLFLKGEAVRNLQLIFLRDWAYMTKETKLEPVYLSPPQIDHERTEGGVQVIASGPDQQWEVIKKLFFSMITSAKKSIWIASPYFVPDEDLLSALKIASLSGVDVRILLPGKPDKKIVFYASRSYFPELIEAGIKVFTYNTGFMHSKFIIIDGEIASIGTANMDMRSFILNFEVNTFLYESRSVFKLVSDFIDDLEQSTLVTSTALLKRPIRHRFMESLTRLLAPIL